MPAWRVCPDRRYGRASMNLKQVLLLVGTAFWWGAIVLSEPITGAAVGGLALIVGGAALASRPAPVPSQVPR
jgi:drug/metabolite transporter (DMT)-like permease